MAKVKPKISSLPNIKKDIITPYDKNLGSYEEPIKTLNRGNEISVTESKDQADNYSIGLGELDDVVVYFFENKLRPSVYMNGETIPVPLMYGSPEVWDSVQKKGMYRDKNGKIISPVIIYRRNNVDRNMNLPNKLDGNKIHHYHVYKTKYNRKNQYVPFGKIGNVTPSEEFKLIAVPDYVTVTYNCVLLTDYVEQSNKIIENINFFSDSYWGDPNKFSFKVNIQSYAQSTEITSGEDRIIKTTFTITLYGYLVNNDLVRQMAGAKRFFSKSVISLGMEISSLDKESIYLRAKDPIKVMKPGQAPSTGPGGIPQTVDQEIITYLNLNKQVRGNYLATNAMAFVDSTIATPPAGMPPNGLDNFSFFINGIYVIKIAIVSFQQSGANCILTLDTNILGYELKPTYEFSAIGKFV